MLQTVNGEPVSRDGELFVLRLRALTPSQCISPGISADCSIGINLFCMEALSTEAEVWISMATPRTGPRFARALRTDGRRDDISPESSVEAMT